jgi:hypothetical protein
MSVPSVICLNGGFLAISNSSHPDSEWGLLNLLIAVMLTEYLPGAREKDSCGAVTVSLRTAAAFSSRTVTS